MLKKRIKSFQYAFQGIYELFKTQPNSWLHLTATCLVIAMGVFFEITSGEWAIVALAISIVIAAEAFNTAIEYLTDLASPDYHPLAGKAKDLAAAGVLISAFGALAVGLIIFLPKLMAFIQNS